MIWIRPLLSVVLVPSTPMKEDRPATAGSVRMARASACWRSAMAVNEIDWAASEMPRIAPVSCTGKKPLGTAIYSTIVSRSIPTATTSVAG